MIRMRGRFDHGTLRAAGFVLLLSVVFLVTNTSVAAAANGSAPGGGLLAPLDLPTSEGVPLSGYQLDSSTSPVSVADGIANVVTGNMPFDVAGEIQRLLLSGLFTLVRLLVGLCCWLIGFVFDFPLLHLLTDPAQRLADAYQRHVVDALGLKGLLLAWAFVFGLILFVRGKAGKGLGEIAMTLVIAALATSAFVRPDYVLGKDGPLQQVHQAAIEVASITTASYFDSPGRGSGSCDNVVGPAHDVCISEKTQAKTVTGPIQDALTDALVVKPYMLLQYGRILDPGKEDEKAAYEAHLTWIASNAPPPAAAASPAATQPPSDGEDPCALLIGSAKTYCKDAQLRREKDKICDGLDAISKKRCLEAGKGEAGFSRLIKDLKDAGSVGKAAAAYGEKPSWDRVWSVLALLAAVVVVALMVVSMAVVMLAAQGADAATAAGGPIAWVWAMLPGPSRMLLWRWLGVFVVSALVAFMAAMALPLFGIAVNALLADSGPDQMMERLLLVDALALGFLVLHRRILRATAGFGQRMATRMRYAKVGGSHLPGDNSELGAALAMHRPTGASGLGGRVSADHGAFGARLRSLGSLAAMTDGTGMPFTPGRLIGDALAEGRRGIAPLAMVLRGAHTALVGPKPGQHPAAAALHRVAASGPSSPAGHQGEIQVDKWTGEVLHDPATDRPLLGSRIHARASRLRGYRIAHGTAHLAYGTTAALPRTLRAARNTASEYTQDAYTQLRVAANQVREDGASWKSAIHAVRRGIVRTPASPEPPAQPARPTVVFTPNSVSTPPGPSRQGQVSGWPQPTRTPASRPVADNGRARPGLTSASPAPAQPPAQVAQAQAEAEAAAQANRDRLLSAINARRAATRRRNPGGDAE